MCLRRPCASGCGRAIRYSHRDSHRVHRYGCIHGPIRNRRTTIEAKPRVRAVLAADRACTYGSTVYVDVLNATNLACYGKFHVFVAVQDSKDGPLFDFAKGLTDEGIYSTTYAFPGAGGVSGASGNFTSFYSARGPAATSLPYCTGIPYQKLNTKMMKSTWKKLNSKSFTLAAADNHRYTFVIRHNQVAVKEHYTDSGVEYMKGSIVIVLESQGALIKDSTATTGTYGLSAGEIRLSVTRKVQIAPMRAKITRMRGQYFGNGTVSGSAARPGTPPSTRVENEKRIAISR